MKKHSGVKVPKMSIGHHAKKMMKHHVRSEPSRSSGGHSPHAPYPLPYDHNYLPGRPHNTKHSSASKGQGYSD